MSCYSAMLPPVCHYSLPLHSASVAILAIRQFFSDVSPPGVVSILRCLFDVFSRMSGVVRPCLGLAWPDRVSIAYCDDRMCPQHQTVYHVYMRISYSGFFVTLIIGFVYILLVR